MVNHFVRFIGVLVLSIGVSVPAIASSAIVWECQRPNGITDTIAIYGKGNINAFNSGDEVVPTTDAAFTCCPNDWGVRKNTLQSITQADFVNITLFPKSEPEAGDVSWFGTLYLRDVDGKKSGTFELKRATYEKVGGLLIMPKFGKNVSSKCKRGEDVLSEDTNVEPVKSVVPVTIASASYKDFPHDQTISYKFMDKNQFLDRSCYLNSIRDRETQKFFNCFVDEDSQAIPVVECTDQYLDTGRPAHVTKSDLLQGLRKALEWSEVNRSAKVEVDKGLPPYDQRLLSFAGFEDGRSMIFIDACPLQINQISGFITEIEKNYDKAKKKALSTDLEVLFN